MVGFEKHPLHPGEGIPIFISSGILKEPAQLKPFMKIEDPLAAPLLTIGGFTMPEWSGNAKAGQQDFVYYPGVGMAGNARGLPNPGEAGIRLLREPIRVLSEMGIKTIIQVNSLPHESPLIVIPDLVELAAEQKPTAIEVNLSCPNGLKADGSFHSPLCYDADASGEVVMSSRTRIGSEITLGVKDSPHLQLLHEKINQGEVIGLAISLLGLIDFVTGINAIEDQPFPELTCTNGRGGMSGPIIRETAKRHLRLWHEFAPEIPYLSCGGIDSENASTEIPERLSLGAMRVGGAQEFFRSSQPHLLAARWAQEAA